MLHTLAGYLHKDSITKLSLKFPHLQNGAKPLPWAVAEMQIECTTAWSPDQEQEPLSLSLNTPPPPKESVTVVF